MTSECSVSQDKLHLFALYGQSNMQGAGVLDEFVEELNPRILKMTFAGDCEMAKEPMHDWSSEEEKFVVGPGYYFAKRMLDHVEPDVSIGLIPHARGGTRLDQWEQATSGAYPRIVERCNNARKKGVLKGVLWHQGESDCASEEAASGYARRFVAFFEQFRKDVGIHDLPVVIGQLGEFLREREDNRFVDLLNEQLAAIPTILPYSARVESTGATHIGDFLHFDTRTQRDVMAPRYVEAMLKLLKGPK